MHQTKQPQHKSRLTTAQLEALIPAGPVSRHRAARDRIEIESIAEGNRGDTIVTGQRVVDPIMRLHRAGHISIQEVQAAFTFRRDHDRAYATSSNVLTSLCVDSGGSREHALDKQLHHATRYRSALTHFGTDLGCVAQCAVVEGYTYGAIGAQVLPSATRPEQIRTGRKMLVTALQKLALFYGAPPGHFKARGVGIAAQALN
jgi:hypothetical protein